MEEESEIRNSTVLVFSGFLSASLIMALIIGTVLLIRSSKRIL